MVNAMITRPRPAKSPLRLAALLLLALQACALLPGRQNRALHNSPDFQAGYHDGCSSAGGPSANPRADSVVRDEALFRTSKAYQVGWRAGFGACRPSNANPYAGAVGLPGTGPVPEPPIGNGGLPQN